MDMHDTQMGQMSSDVLEIVDRDGGEFVLIVRLADGRAIRTQGRVATSSEGQSAEQRSFDFDSEDFQREVMKGNIDIRAVCTTLGQIIKAPQ
jgi:hypothetical protein